MGIFREAGEGLVGNKRGLACKRSVVKLINEKPGQVGCTDVASGTICQTGFYLAGPIRKFNHGTTNNVHWMVL